MLKRTTINIEEQQLEQLDIIAEALEMTRNKLIAFLIEKCIRDNYDYALSLQAQKNEIEDFKRKFVQEIKLDQKQ